MDLTFHDIFKHMTNTAIETYQVHIHHAPCNTFINTVILQSYKLAPVSFRPQVVAHPHPQNSVQPFPFCILNRTIVKTKEHIVRHIISVVDDKSIQRSQGEQPQITSNVLMSHDTRALLNICEELAQVATATNEDQLNPYYIFMNPILKWREYNKEQARKQRLMALQELTKNGQINADWVIYQLQILEKLYLKMQETERSDKMKKLCKIILVALIKHLRVNNPKMFKAALKQKTIEEVEKEMVHFLVQLNAQPAPPQPVRFLSQRNFTLARPKPKQEEEEYTPWAEKLTKALVLPVSVTSVLLIIRRAFAM